MKAGGIAILVLVVLALAAGRKYVTVRAELIGQRKAMSDAWLELETVLERHATTVSGLVDGVKDTLRDQPQIQQDMAAASAALLNGHSPEEKIQANARLNAALAKFLLWSETTVRSKSEQGFARLETELADAEGHIALPRRKYNEALEHYNAQIQHFPENVVASISGFSRNDAYFKTEPGERPPTKAPF